MLNGVNEELLIELLNMNKNERLRIYLNLMENNPNAFRKLLIRMGYSLSEFDDEKRRKRIINEICDDAVIRYKLSEARRRR